MNQPIPETPINVQRINPYVGPDRGLFLIQYPAGPKVARVHAVRYVTKGPAAAVGVLEYQVMQYSQTPTTPREYASGELLSAPDGTTWFDRLARGTVLDPILAEYWATDSFLNWYRGDTPTKLTQPEKDKAHTQAQSFASVMGDFAGLVGVELTVNFMAIDGAPLSRFSAVLAIDYTKDGQPVHVEEVNLPDGDFDPVRVALSIIRANKEV